MILLWIKFSDHPVIHGEYAGRGEQLILRKENLCHFIEQFYNTPARKFQTIRPLLLAHLLNELIEVSLLCLYQLAVELADKELRSSIQILPALDFEAHCLCE